jgi:FAD:protein FMN transferase
VKARAQALRRFGLVLALALAGCAQETPIFTARFEAFGSTVDLSIVGVDEATAQRASSAIERDLRQLHEDLHAWEPGPLGYVNEQIPTGKPFVVPPSLLPIIREGQRLAAASENLFNPAIGKLIELWGFHADTPKCQPPPPAKQIERLVKSNPRMSDLHLDGILLRSDNRDVRLDFGAYGKGYGIDLAIGHLRELGVRNAMLSAGGDLRAIGSRAGQPWRIPIRRGGGHGVLAVIEVRGDESVFTSASHQRNFVYEGKTYHHIIDPRTGHPAEGTQSVTVIHTDAATAGAATTALFVAGPESWYRIARGLGVRHVLLVDGTGTVHMSPSMAERVQLLDKSTEIELSPPLIPAPPG